MIFLLLLALGSADHAEAKRPVAARVKKKLISADSVGRYNRSRPAVAVAAAQASNINTADSFSVMAQKVFDGSGKLPNKLRDVLGTGQVRLVLDAQTGRGEWMRRIRTTRWLARNARIVGHDLKAPASYPGGAVNIRKDWRGLAVVLKKSDRRYPSPGSVDLLHWAFGHIKPIWALKAREKPTARPLNGYTSSVKEGGWMLFAHNEYHARSSYFTDWLEKKGYPYIVFRGDEVPSDYPRTYWWRHIVWSASWLRDYSSNYLILARKEPVDR